MRGMILGSFVILVAATALSQEKIFEGYVTDDMCGAEHMMEGMSDKQCADECVGMGAAYALYVPDDEMLYAVDDPEKIKPFAGEDVVVNGTLDEDGETIRIASVARAEQR